MWELVILGVVLIISVMVYLCVDAICDAVIHKYSWMYEGHEERDERFVHEKEMQDGKA